MTLWGAHVDDLKAVVYTLRFDTGSAVYGEFGRFYVGVTDTLDDVLDQLDLERLTSPAASGSRATTVSDQVSPRRVNRRG